MSGRIREAIVLARPEDAVRSVAGVPLLVRTVLALQRAGIERCTLVGGAAPPRDPRIRCALATAPGLAPAPDDALRLVVGDGAVIDDTLVRDVAARARPGEALEVRHQGARVRVAPGPLVAGDGGVRLAPRAGTLASAAGDAAGIERRLLRALENPRDGYLDRLINRRFSRPLTRLLLRTPLSPNAVTAAGVALGVAGGLLLGMAVPAATAGGIVLLIASGVLDCSDGELARLRFAESRLGHWLDIAGDTLVHASVLAGIAGRLAAEGRVPGRGWLALLGLGVVAAFAAMTWSEGVEDRRRRVPGWENRLLDGLLSPLTTRDWYVFPIAFALAGKLEWLVPAAAVGAHAFWLCVVVLLARTLGRTR